MKTSIQYKTHTLSDGFYHAAWPVLFAQHDTPGALADCPFPLQTDSFKVLMFGTVKTSAELGNDPEGKYGTPGSGRFAVVEFTKSCGHSVQERITFTEGVQTFDHYGTVFTGESYSINDWQRRIEFFRGGRCDVCGIVHRCLWIYAGGMSEEGGSRKKLLARLDLLLNANFHNWQDFTPWADIERRAIATRWNSDKVAD